jgi:hypothetical protein
LKSGNNASVSRVGLLAYPGWKIMYESEVDIEGFGT